MLKYIRNISKITTVFFSLVFAIPIIYLHHVVAENIIKTDIFERNQNLSGFYASNVWNKYSSIVNNLHNIPKNKWQDDEDFITFALDSFNFWSNIRSVNISVFNAYGDKLISTNKNKLDYKAPENKISKLKDINLLLDKMDSFFNLSVDSNPQKLALSGKQTSEILLSALYKDAEGFTRKGTLIISHIPIFSVNKQVVGYFTMTRDISGIWEELSSLRLQAIIISSIVVYIMYLLATLNVRDSKLALEVKQKENLKLLKEKVSSDISNKRKSKFLINIGNQLKPPLDNIIKNLEILKNEVYGTIGNKKYKDNIDNINEFSEYMNELIDDIIEYSKAETGKMSVTCIPIEVRKIINSAVRLSSDRAEQSVLEITKTIPDENIIILADPRKLKQALNNLLSNALKFTPADGKINISVSKDSNEHNIEMVHIIIEDTGVGMEENEIANVLSLFKEENSHSHLSTEKTGLGLPYAKNIVEMMNGKFTLESKLGFGTKVTLSFYSHENV